MLGEKKKPESLLIVMICVLLTSAMFPGNLFAETVIEEWIARYSGLENSCDEPYAMAVDASGNVYVTGRRTTTDTHQDYATIKYDSSGNELWVATYNGPGNSNDEAVAVALDASGNVYVTGGSVGSGTAMDFATIKYDSYGNELWVARYDGPGNWVDYAESLALDSEGNVYVTGPSCITGGGTYYDYATVKYDSDGNQCWVARYGSPGILLEYACAITVDSEGNVYVTGWSSEHLISPPDYATVKYDSSGNELWVARYNGPSNDSDRADAIAVDSEGNVYVTGRSYGSGTDMDYATVKYDSDGSELWVARYNGPANGSDRVYTMALDASGDIYVTGYSYGSGTDADYATVKYDSSGNELWVARYNGPGNGYDEAYAMALDAEGNVYVTGMSDGSVTYGDYATVKYDSAGNELWVARYNGPANSYDYAYAIALDGSGNVYVTGLDEGIGTYCDWATIKYARPADPIELLLALAQDVIELNLQNGIENSLDAKLSAALGALRDVNENNNGAAINTLQAFINAVEAQSGSKIATEDADALIATAQEIISALSGP